MLQIDKIIPVEIYIISLIYLYGIPMLSGECFGEHMHRCTCSGVEPSYLLSYMSSKSSTYVVLSVYDGNA